MFVKYEVLAPFERWPGFDKKRCVKKIPVAVLLPSRKVSGYQKETTDTPPPPHGHILASVDRAEYLGVRAKYLGVTISKDMQ